MKRVKFLFILCLLISSTICQAQFPAPLHLKMSGEYIMINEMGYCRGKMVIGPTYYTDFQWETPKISEIKGQLTGYNIYYYQTDHYYEGMEIPFSEAKIIAHTADTSLQLESGITGVAWVTAVYSDPQGESQPSNFVVSTELPIGVQEIRKSSAILYNSLKNGIEVFGIENITSIHIFRLDGIIIKSVSSNFSYIDMRGIEKGTYIIKIIMKEGKNIIEKIVLN